MNHYERLKVAPDAPPEVIRAAYRALATKLHPDRQGGDAGPSEEAHEAMAALNASYLVLTNAKARAAYDAQMKAEQDLAAGRKMPGAHMFRTGGFKASEFQPSAFHTDAGGPNTAGGGPATAAPAAADNGSASMFGDSIFRDISWLRGKPGATAAAAGAAHPGGWGYTGTTPSAKPIPRWAWALLASSLASAAVMGWMVWREAQQRDFEKTLHQVVQADAADSRRMTGQVLDAPALPPDLPADVKAQIEAAAQGDAASTAMPDEAASGEVVPTVRAEDLEKLSNDELLAQMPDLIAGKTPASASPSTAGKPPASTTYSWQQGRHHLDGGQALSLKLSTSTQLSRVPASP